MAKILQDIKRVKPAPRKTENKEIPKPVLLRQIPDKENINIREKTVTYSDFEGAPKQNRKGTKYGLWLVAGICIIVFLFALSFLFARANVDINPKVKDLVLNENLSADKDSNTGGLSFDLMVISGEESKDVPAGEAKDVSLKATGTVIIYNSLSPAPQKLNIDTRLEGSNGKMYKTATSLVVPGMSADGTPGQVEAGIYAESAGDAYNSVPLDFKVFGFKGTPKYDKFYGRSKGSISGGFEGKSPVITDDQKASTLSELKTVLLAKLFEKATGQIPAGFILFKDAVFLNIDDENVGYNSGSTDLPVTVKGTLYGFLFNEQSLTKKIAKDTIPGYDDSDVYIPDIRNLNFSLVNKDTSFGSAQNINFTLSGPAKIVWKFDDAKLATDLLGRPKSDFNKILAQYPNIDSANLSLTPFWARSLPSKSKDIKIVVNYPK